MNLLRTVCVCLLVGLTTLPTTVVADTASITLRRELFANLDEGFRLAKERNADLLAPEAYERAEKYYKSAEKRFYNNRVISDIREDIGKSYAQLRAALDTAKIAEVPFGPVIQARANAVSANAAEYASVSWQAAEEAFRKAALKLEDGNIRHANEAAKELTAMYQQTELQAIKENYLSGARNLIAQAEELKAERYAMKTLVDARLLLKDAERELTENRYDTDYPRDLARRARNEAQHAITITNLAIGVKKKDFSVEDIITNYEKPLAAIAGELNIVASLHEGYEKTTAEVLDKVKQLQKDSAELAQYKIQNKEQALEIARLAEQLGIKSEALAAEERYRALLADIEGIFTEEEAQIFRQDKNMIIRMIGLNFDSNKAELKPSHLPLVAKVQQAIELSKSDLITIEGHTDSYGGDDSNLKLSEERAQAVVVHLVTKMQVDPAIMRAVGYGETRPIANNESPEGREKNRRIDVVIRLAK